MDRFAHFNFHPNIPMGQDGRPATGSQAHIDLSRKAANEGMVLLKNNNGILPLKKGARIAVFGTAQFDYVRGGGGSGDVTTAYTRNIYEGFSIKEKEGLVEIFHPLSEYIGAEVKLQKKDNPWGRCSQPEIPEELLEKAKAFTDTALFTICRYSWEGGDRKSGPDEEDYYLSASEIKLMKLLEENFKHIIVIFDVGAVIDTEWFKDNDRFESVLMAWQAGIEGGLAIADTVCGCSNPSGRLVDTFPDSFDAFPSSAHFNDSQEYADYTEDIYVGYRYFTTFTEAAGHVNYPFGYGLSYTEFSTSCEGCIVSGDTVRVLAKVTNTGSVDGKNAVGLYYSAPTPKNSDARLYKPGRELGAFAKTALLKPGESEILTLELPVSAMASFDDLGHIQKSAYVLEKGMYTFYLGADVSRAEKIEKVYNLMKGTEAEGYLLEETVITEQCSSLCPPHRLEKRLLGDGSYEALATDDSPADVRTTCYTGWTVPTGRTIIGALTPAKTKVGSGTIIDPEDEQNENGIPSFGEVAEGNLSLEEFMSKLPVEVLIELLGGTPNTGVTNTFGMGNFCEIGIPNVTTADGPAGLRVAPGVGVTTTAWPIATMLACTWNTALVEEVGAAGGLEVKENHIGLWLTPAMNIHRSPLCGRNFEYYSEDPLITGKMGAAMIRGIQSQRVGATMKHFATNNKEENRFVCDSRVSERALREIYLKGFEIAVKEAAPWVVMSSYNRLNGQYTSRCRDLLDGILRKEWGFDGMITTDWMNASAQVPEIKAGNDLKMPIGEPAQVLEAYKKGEISKDEIYACAERILKTILKFE